MEIRKIIDFIEDKDIILNDDWYYHATQNNIEIIKKILQGGIKSAYLRNKSGNNFNGKYYISLYKYTKEAKDIRMWAHEYPKFIINNITPYYADRKKYNFRKLFINTKIPLRTSEWDGEYQEYLKIEPSKIIAIDYSISTILSNLDNLNAKEKLIFLKNIVLVLKELNINLPIYDIASLHELNKDKVLSLNL